MVPREKKLCLCKQTHSEHLRKVPFFDIWSCCEIDSIFQPIKSLHYVKIPQTSDFVNFNITSCAHWGTQNNRSIYLCLMSRFRKDAWEPECSMFSSSSQQVFNRLIVKKFGVNPVKCTKIIDSTVIYRNQCIHPITSLLHEYIQLMKNWI